MVSESKLSCFLNRVPLPPIQSAALGALIGFYFLFNIHIAAAVICFFIFLGTFYFFRVLSSLNTDSRMLRVITVCSAAFAAGVFIGLCAANAGRNDIRFGIPESNVVAVEGVLLEDPRIVSSGSAMALVSLRRSAGAGGLRVSSRGEITVFFPQESANKIREYGRGARVFAEGTVRSSPRGMSISAKSLHIIKPAPVIERIRTNVRLNLINRFEGKEWGGLALALLLGIRDNLDTDLVSFYRSAGLSYILALSGMHLAIIAAIISFILKKPLGLKASAITGAVIIILYCLLVGPMPSLNRAALMYVLGVLAILGALPKNAMSILSLSFLIQLFITPAAGNSLSFILSYLALLGILIIGKAISFLLAGKIPEFLLQPLSLSCGAFLITAGVCSAVFGTIAPVGIIAGLVIVPLTTLFMIGSMIWLLLDFLPVFDLLNLPLLLLYRLMEVIASAAGKVSGISANSFLVLIVSVVLMLFILVLEYKRKNALFKLEQFT